MFTRNISGFNKSLETSAEFENLMNSEFYVSGGLFLVYSNTGVDSVTS